jgi:phosphatidate cytidylyltransferase
MLWQRILSSLVLIPLIVTAIWLDGLLFTVAVILFSLLGVFEFYRLAQKAGWKPFALIGIIFVLLFLIDAYYFEDARTTGLLISGIIIFPLIQALFCREIENAFINWLWTVGGVFYVGWTMSHFILLRELESGLNWVLLVVLTTMATDTFAFIAGRAFGRHRLIPSISPGKTWEGSVGGIIGAVIAIVLIAYFTGLDSFGYGWLIGLGCLIGIVAQLGDLSESLLKRNVNAKDASKLIPGHGGVLDRLDSLIFAVVLTYYYVIWIVI